MKDIYKKKLEWKLCCYFRCLFIVGVVVVFFQVNHKRKNIGIFPNGFWNIRKLSEYTLCELCEVFTDEMHTYGWMDWWMWWWKKDSKNRTFLLLCRIEEKIHFVKKINSQTFFLWNFRFSFSLVVVGERGW